MPVKDETCTGDRLLPPAPAHCPDEASFYPVYARALLTQWIPCMRMLDIRDRQTGEEARGIVYHTMKFCDYYSFEYSGLKARSEVPLLKIETDTTPQSRARRQGRPARWRWRFSRRG